MYRSIILLLLNLGVLQHPQAPTCLRPCSTWGVGGASTLVDERLQVPILQQGVYHPSLLLFKVLQTLMKGCQLYVCRSAWRTTAL